jgi:Fur family ferric uptake transcriptional regulator
MSKVKLSLIEKKCIEKGLKLTGQRKIIAKILSESRDHPDVEELHNRLSQIDKKISIATIYRTLRLFEEVNIIKKLNFGDGRARYEHLEAEHHHHLIDLQSGKVIEFHNEELEKLKHTIAHQLGYKLIDHKLELYGVPLTLTKKK